jgi:hypothetical protein
MLILDNLVFSTFSTFYMCSLKVPPQVIKQIEENIAYGVKEILKEKAIA